MKSFTIITTNWTLSLSPSVLTAIFQMDLGQPIPECHQSGFCWS